jgi:hypothetical protein
MINMVAASLKARENSSLISATTQEPAKQDTTLPLPEPMK